MSELLTHFLRKVKTGCSVRSPEVDELGQALVLEMGWVKLWAWWLGLALGSAEGTV